MTLIIVGIIIAPGVAYLVRECWRSRYAVLSALRGARYEDLEALERGRTQR